MYLPKGRVEHVRCALWAIIVSLAAVCVAQISLTSIQLTRRGFGERVTVNEVVVIGGLVCSSLASLWLTWRAARALRHARPNTRTAKMLLHKTFRVLARDVTWVMLFHVVLFQRALSAALLLPADAVSWVLVGVTVVPIVFPIGTFVLHCCFTARPNGVLLVTAPFIGLASLVVALYMSVTVVYIERYLGQGWASWTINVVQVRSPI